MQRLEVSGAVRPLYGSLGVKRLNAPRKQNSQGFRSNEQRGHNILLPLLSSQTLCKQRSEFN